jgi:hypothetical protein
MRNAISACSALAEICEPQLGPTKFTLTASLFRSKWLVSASSILVCVLNGTFAVCTCQLCLSPTPSFCTIASLPPPAPMTTLVISVVVALLSLNWKTEPPLNSTL